MEMRKFQIITDSACDLPDDYYVQNRVELVPLGFQMDGVIYGGESGDSIDVKDFYARLRAGSMPTTFQISSDQAKLHIEKFAAEGENVLVIAFSGALSGTANSFAVAAKEVSEKYPNAKIIVVDSLCASMGEGLLLDYVVKKADSGATIEETAAYAEELKRHICHFFTVENLFHLKRGGRVSAATAVVGSMLQIKPVLHVDDEGRLISIGKAMGRKKSISALVERMKETEALKEDDVIFISHGDCPSDAETLAGLIKKNFGERKIVINEIGAVIGTHSGAGTLAVFFVGSHR